METVVGAIHSFHHILSISYSFKTLLKLLNVGQVDLEG